MVNATTSVVETRWRGEPTLALQVGDTRAVLLPGLGMTAVSLRVGRREFLATPGGPAALRGGNTAGIPLLAPWANRLGPDGYRAAGVTVDLRSMALRRDDHGLPMHGLLVGASGWRIDASPRAGATDATVTAVHDLDAPAFPFPHRVGVGFRVREHQLDVTTTVVPTGRRRVPVAFGWHPYLRVPGTARSRWRLRLPARTHLVLDDLGLPTGARVREAAEAAPIGRRTFDDLYELGRDRVLALESDDGAVTLRAGAGYAYAQVWAPPGRPFAALEPMTVPTNALASGTPPLVAPGDRFTARYSLTLS